MSAPRVTFCVLTYADYTDLFLRTLESIERYCPRGQYRVVVGANSPGETTLLVLEQLVQANLLHQLHVSSQNINKCPMMRRMFASVDTELTWWLDDDSHFTHPNAFRTWLEAVDGSPTNTVAWGQECWFNDTSEFSYGTDVAGFVKRASWYRGKEPPSHAPGGRGVTDFEGRGGGDPRWFFLTGGCWLMRTEALRALDWPDRRLIKRNDDVFLGEAIRQQGWDYMHVGPAGVEINDAPTRGSGESREVMERQMGAPLEGPDTEKPG